MFEFDLLVSEKLFKNMDLAKEKEVINSGFYDMPMAQLNVNAKQ